MSSRDVVGDGEIVLRRIPPGTTWQAPGPRVTSNNFKLRTDRGESGVSVSRQSLTSAASLLDRLPEEVIRVMGDRSAWRIAAATVREIRQLGLDVLPAPTDDDPGHALITSGELSLHDHAARKALSRLFEFIELPDQP